jgi:hypothetical protein
MEQRFFSKKFGARILEKFNQNIRNFSRVYTLKPKKLKNFLISLWKNGNISPGKNKDQSFCFHFLMGLINWVHPKRELALNGNRFLEQVQKVKILLKEIPQTQIQVKMSPPKKRVFNFLDIFPPKKGNM